MSALETITPEHLEVYSDSEIAKMADVTKKISGVALLGSMLNEANPDTVITNQE